MPKDKSSPPRVVAAPEVLYIDKEAEVILLRNVWLVR